MMNLTQERSFSTELKNFPLQFEGRIWPGKPSLTFLTSLTGAVSAQQGRGGDSCLQFQKDFEPFVFMLDD